MLFLILCLATAQTFSQNQTLTVTVKNVKNGDGFVSVAVYHSSEEFMKKSWQSKRMDSQTGEVQFIFDNLPAGDYAISVMHDANKNGKLDTNMVGIPKEGFGFSNDAMGTFGPPDFEKAKFAVPASQGIFITLKYY